jgi:hypothetical protein
MRKEARVARTRQMVMGLTFFVGFVLLFTLVATRQHGIGASQQLRGKIAVLWVFTGEPTFYWKWSLATLLNAGADRINVHMFIGVGPERLDEYRLQLRDYAQADKVLFHSMTPEDWKLRISSKMGINITYPLESLGRKVADFKPCLGDLFQDLLPVKEYAFWVYGDSDGFFGSYNQMLNYSVVPLYDVVGGQPEPPKGSEVWSSIPGQWVPNYCTGGWTMMRNTRRVNTLYRRSRDWQKMLTSPDYRSFDEDSTHLESMQKVLKNGADDLRRCCINSRTPQVLAERTSPGAPQKMFIAGMDEAYVSGSSTLRAHWQAGRGLVVNVEGNLGREKRYRNETNEVLFMHFLQFKYCCGKQLFDAMKAFLASQPNILNLRCFKLFGTAPKSFTFETC